MSWQMAMMGAQMGMTVLGGIQGMNAAGAAADQQIMAAKIKAAGARTAAAGTELEMSETKYATEQQEIARRREIARLWQANAIDLVGRGGVSDGTDSMAALQRENARLGEADISNIKLMGESRVAKLSFRQTQQNLMAMGADLEAINTGENLTRQQTMMATQMVSKLLGIGASFGMGGGGGDADAGIPGSNDAAKAAVARYGTAMIV